LLFCLLFLLSCLVTYCSIKGLVSRVFARYYYKIFFKHTSIENKEVNTTYEALLL
jgi:hypothetical protein